MRLRTWLDSLAHRHASTRSPKKRRSHGPKATTHKTYAAYQSLASETLEPRQLLTATSGSTDLEDVDFTQAVQLTDLSSESGENSSDTSGSLAGFKWHDANGNGAWDSGEAGLADWTIYIDANENGALDSGEASTTTAIDGSYRFNGLAPGNYTIGEVQQEGWQQTYPDSLGNAAGSSVDTSNLSTPEILVGAAYTDGELIVKLRDAASAPGVLGDLRSLQKTVGGTTLRAAEDLGFELWSIEGDVKDAIAQWGDNPSFQYIQPNYTITVDATVPNDTEFDRLWGLHNTGQTGGASDADIDAVEAWDLQTGGNVVVGVIDTGIDYTHPDLVANIWTNPGEIAGNNIDDDGNGYIDDIHGYDFAYGDGDPMDVHSHGTHVAGTIAASGNNAQGVVGVNWNAQLMALKFLNDNGSGSTFAAIQAVEYATMMDVRVTNNSWGGGGYSQALYNAIAAAGEHDALFVAAAGNSGSDNDALPHYPSNYDLNNVISVASTTHTDSLSGFSSYGATTVDLAAPGSSIYSTVPYGRYAGYSGTSMATPHVAGVVAMVMAEDPSLSAAQVKQVILDSVDPLASLDGKVLSGGRLNAYNALQSLRVPGTHNVDLAEGQQITGLHFGGWVLGPATVSGFSFGDQNDDGLRGQDENGLSGWTVFLDTNDDGLLNAGEASVVTDSTGYYAFTDLSPGSYAVTQRSKPNWTQTTPTATTEYSSAEIEYGWQEISGIGTQVSLGDDQSQAISLPFEFDFYGQQKTSVSISSNGYLTFGGDGTDHTNDPIPHTAQPNDLIAAFWDDLNPTQGGDIYYYHDIAESRLIVQYENIPHYSSGGTYTFEAMLYANGNIEYHYKSIGGSHSATVGIENADASNGLQLGYNDSFASSGKAVRVTPAVNVARPHVVTVTWNAVSENHNFGNLFVTPGTLAGAAWADENNDGNWDSTEATLADIVIYLDLDDSGSLTSGDQQTTTDTAGNYQFTTAAGTYDIRAVAPPNRTVTAPADGVHDAISVLHGGAVENLHFGFALNLPGSLSGFKWHDVDGDRTWDSEEVGLAGWTIYLDTNENGALDSGEASTTTAGDGSYRFEGVQPGTYSIGEVLQEGWQQTYPDAMGGASSASDAHAVLGGSDHAGTNLTTDDPFQTLRVPGTHQVTIDWNQNLTDLNFGAMRYNQRPSFPDATFTIAESTEVGTVVGTLQAMDPEGISLTYSIASNIDTDADGIGAFALDGNTLVVSDAGDLEYEVQSELTILVEASDGLKSDQATITVQLTDINDSPSAVSLANRVESLPDDANTLARIRMADIQVTDDSLGSNAISLSGADAAHFEVVGTALYLRAGTALDTDVQSSYAVTVGASDSSLSATPVTTEMTLTVTEGTLSVVTLNDPTDNLVSGGSFDNISVSGRLWNQHRLGFVPSIPGWSNANRIEVWGQSFLTRIFGERAGTEERGQVLELDNASSGGLDWIQQGIATEQGAQYLILIDALGRTGNGASDDLQLLWNNNTFHTATTAEMRGQSWQTFGGLVTGTGGTNTLRISETSGGNDGVGPLIDNVRAYRYEPETPAIDEGLPGGTEVTHLLVTLLDGASYSNLRLAEDGGGRFALDAETGLITTTGSLNYDADPASYRLTVAVDTEEGTQLQYVNIILNETNQGPTAVHLSDTLAAVAEDADTSSRTRVATIEITDDGAGTNIVSLTGADADQFEVMDDSLYLKANRMLDYETQASYSVTVSVEDNAIGNPVTASMTLGITDANDAPAGVGLVNATAVISDRTDTSSAVKIADILVMDDALGSNALTLSGADAGSFEVVGTALYLRAGTALDTDVQSSYSVTVGASDSSLSGSTPVTTSFTLTVSEVNFAPTAVHLSSTLAAVAEDADTNSRTRVATIEITDDGAGTNTVSLAGVDADQFEVVGDSLYLKANRTLDYETQASYSVTVSARDSSVAGSNPVTAAMTLGITDANDAPAAVALVNAISSLSDATDTTSRVKVADIHITDDALGNNALTLSGADAAHFEVVGTALYLRAGTALDTDVQSSYAMTVGASDSSLPGSTPVTTELNLEVTPPGSGNMVIATYDGGNNLVSGGSFDNIPVSGRSWNQHRLAFVSSIPGWSNANRIEVWGQSFLTRIFAERAGTEERGQVLELDNASSGGLDWIQQGIATEQGAQYLILIDALGRTGNGASDDLQLRWNNNTFHTATTAEMRGQSWQTFGGLVTGTGGTNTLRISETASGNDGVGPLIDNVRAYRYEPETPSIDEGLPGGTEVTHLLVTLLDGASYSNLRLAEDGGGRFALDAETGLITTTGSLNYDTDPASYRLTVAVDTEEGTQLQYVNIILNETNQGPTAVHLSSTLAAVAEDADTSSRTRVAHIAITDDGAGTNIVSLAGADADQFEVVGDSLYLKANRMLDYETQASYSVTVSVEDSVIGNPVTAAMTLGITDANDAPAGVSLVNATTVISDRTDMSSAVKIADIQVTDDALGSNALALGGADAAHFEVAGTELYLRAGTALDTDVQSSYAVTVIASDSSLSGSTPVTTELNLEVTPPGSGNMVIATYDGGNNLISGGSFDNGPINHRLWNQHRLGFVSSIPGWSNANRIEVWGQSFLTRIFGERAGTEDRGRVLELDNASSGGLDWIQQSIATEQGAQYLILIDALGRTGNGASDDLQLRWNNNTFHTATTAEMRGQSWQTFGGLVTGTGGSNTLRISETASGNDGVGPLIDNVRAYRYEPETPSIDEGLPGGTEVTHLLVTLLDGASYSNLRLAEDGGGRFALDAETGLITTTGSLNYDADPASYRLTVAVDTEEGTQLQYVNIILNETNQGPTAVHLSSTLATVGEDADTSSRQQAAPTNKASWFPDGGSSEQASLQTSIMFDYASYACGTASQSPAGSTLALLTPAAADLAFSSDDPDELLAPLQDDWQQAFCVEDENPFTDF